mmetsp:Transcript_11593/g.24865  ORF Transcript_11593/g.24865 Transcript_11593/m.24865 type:complete len:508 (-) Transcript_11593:2843-4366(-)
MQFASMGVICFLTLSRIMGKIFCTKASSCCLNSSAGYLASTCLKPPTPPPWMEASAWARVEGPWRPNRVPNTPRAADAVLGRRVYWLPLAGLTFFWSMCRRVTVLVSQYARKALSSCCRSIWLPMTPMMRSKSEVRSAWKERHCKQQRNTMTAARGRPLWKPRLPLIADSSRSSSCLRFSWMSCCCLACSSRIFRSVSVSGPAAPGVMPGVRISGVRAPASSSRPGREPGGGVLKLRMVLMESEMALAYPGARLAKFSIKRLPSVAGVLAAGAPLAAGAGELAGATAAAAAAADARVSWRSLTVRDSLIFSISACSSSTCARASSRCPQAFCRRVMRSSFMAWNFFSMSERSFIWRSIQSRAEASFFSSSAFSLAARSVSSASCVLSDSASPSARSRADLIASSSAAVATAACAASAAFSPSSSLHLRSESARAAFSSLICCLSSLRCFCTTSSVACSSCTLTSSAFLSSSSLLLSRASARSCRNARLAAFARKAHWNTSAACRCDS